MAYKRVIPRDLFNEAKLLKCLGMIALIAHEKGLPNSWTLEHRNGWEAFTIQQDNSDGSLYCGNVFLRHTPTAKTLLFNTPLNSREPHPLYIIRQSDDEVIEVFAMDGTLSSQFILHLMGVTA